MGASAQHVATGKVTWTYDDYCLMPDDRNRYEIIDGELIVSPSPTVTHQKVSKRLLHAIMLHVESTGAGIVFAAPLDLILSSTRVVQPDLVVIRPERRSLITERGIEGGPDLIIEIISPSTERTDRELKRKLYAAEGVTEYWLVDPRAHTMEILTLDVVQGESVYRTVARAARGARVSSTIFALTVALDHVFAP